MKFINKEKIILAELVEPHKYRSEDLDPRESHGWQLVLVVGHLPEGQPIIEVVDVGSEAVGKQLVQTCLGLTQI